MSDDKKLIGVMHTRNGDYNPQQIGRALRERSQPPSLNYPYGNDAHQRPSDDDEGGYIVQQPFADWLIKAFGDSRKPKVSRTYIDKNECFGCRDE